MSRIYDALQRAENDRKAGREAEFIESADSFIAPAAEALPQAAEAAILDEVTQYSWNSSLEALPTLSERGEGVEQFRGLRSQLTKFRDQAPLKTILLSSGMPDEGKTFVAANLAISLARNKSNRILLIDADLRNPSLHSILGAPRMPGLAEFLTGVADLNAILQRSGNLRIVEAGSPRAISNLTFIPAGEGGDHASELVASYRMEELIATLSPHFDWILIDSPPALAFSDAIDLARVADAVLLVARGATTPFKVAQQAQAAFSSSRILGFVLNAVKDAPRNSSYYYGYGKQEAGGKHWRKDKGRKG
jgi:capsular exopolysaccharide synthesis family protein